MAKRGKRYQALLEKVDRTREYTPEEAIALVKQLATAKFDETVEVALKLGVDPRHADQQVRGTVVLPKGTGKAVRVAVFAQGENARPRPPVRISWAARTWQANRGWKRNFDAAVATPDMMGVVGRLGRILGPRSDAEPQGRCHGLRSRRPSRRSRPVRLSSV